MAILSCYKTVLKKHKNTSHKKPKDFCGDYNKPCLETFNETLPLLNETIDKNTKNERTKAAKNQIFTNTVTHLIAVFPGD